MTVVDAAVVVEWWRPRRGGVSLIEVGVGGADGGWESFDSRWHQLDLGLLCHFLCNSLLGFPSALVLFFPLICLHPLIDSSPSSLLCTLIPFHALIVDALHSPPASSAQSTLGHLSLVSPLLPVEG